MSLYKREDSPNWWVDLTHDGRRIQQSSGTSDRAKAQEHFQRATEFIGRRAHDETAGRNAAELFVTVLTHLRVNAIRAGL